LKSFPFFKTTNFPNKGININPKSPPLKVIWFNNKKLEKYFGEFKYEKNLYL